MMIFDRFTNLKYRYGNRKFWCRGYYVDTVGRNNKVIEAYIKNQLQEDKEYEQLTMDEMIDPFTGESNQKGKLEKPLLGAAGKRGAEGRSSCALARPVKVPYRHRVNHRLSRWFRFCKKELRGGNGNTNTVAHAFHRPADDGEIPRPVSEEAYMQRPIRFTAVGDILITRCLRCSAGEPGTHHHRRHAVYLRLFW